ncbi:hypothetical protein ACQR3V_06925 [Rhodococcus erythropolis]|uniref:hypothetical protein n=1 Tax=Rhodococcus erythropolis TaxID=1833 RepID=UPI003D104BFB
MSEIANPRRAEGDSIGPRAMGFGINGQYDRWPEDITTWEVDQRADGINCCPADSPLRALADTMSTFSFTVLDGWGSALAKCIRGNRWELNHRDWWRDPICHWQLWSQAAALMDGYVRGGTHNVKYRTGDYCDRLAALLNAHRPQSSPGTKWMVDNVFRRCTR